MSGSVVLFGTQTSILRLADPDRDGRTRIACVPHIDQRGEYRTDLRTKGNHRQKAAQPREPTPARK